MKIEVEMELQSPVEKVWNALKESCTIFPKAIPQIYYNIQPIKGDGKSSGSSRLINYKEGHPITWAMERVEKVDERAKTVHYSMFEGDVLKYYKSFKNSIGVVPNGDKSEVTWIIECKTKSKAAPSEDILRDFTITSLQNLDQYLLQN